MECPRPNQEQSHFLGAPKQHVFFNNDVSDACEVFPGPMNHLVYDPAAETFQLADENAFLLASENTDHFMGGLFLIAPALLRVAPMVAEARPIRKQPMTRLRRNGRPTGARTTLPRRK
jgi:hypothetical protein